MQINYPFFFHFLISNQNFKVSKKSATFCWVGINSAYQSNVVFVILENGIAWEICDTAGESFSNFN